MPMAAPLRYRTADDLDDAPDDGRRWELIDGRLLVTPGPVLEHQSVLEEFHWLLSSYLRPTGRARVFYGPTDVRRDTRTRMQPDLFVVQTSHPGRPTYPFRFEDIPLIIEALSRSSDRADRVDRRAVYLSAGVPQYWVVDHESRCVERWRPGSMQPDVILNRLCWQLDGLTDVLEIDLPSLFARAAFER